MRNRLITTAAALATTALALTATASPAAAANGRDGVTETICHAEGLYLRSEAKPDGHAVDHLEDGWHLAVSYHEAHTMLYAYSPILNRSGYVIDGYFC